MPLQDGADGGKLLQEVMNVGHFVIMKRVASQSKLNQILQ